MSVKDVDLLGNAGSIDKNIDLAVVGSDILNSLLDGSFVTDVDLVETDINAGLRRAAGRIFLQAPAGHRRWQCP